MWNLSSWQYYNALQQPSYKNYSMLQKVKQKLKTLNNLVTVEEINKLKSLLEDSYNNNYFILHIGECAETFKNNFSFKDIINRYNFINDLAKVLEKNLNCKVIKIGRIGGQFAKPRSEEFETSFNTSLNSFKGEIINGFNFIEKDRTPNPIRMLLAYFASKYTINTIKDLNNNTLSPIDYIFSSHEALLLHYEEALTRKVNNTYYNLGTHLLWLGARTSNIDGAHIEYLRGIDNPIAIKVHTGLSSDNLIKIINTLNPFNIKGKIILIVRFGNGNISKYLPQYIKAIKKEGLNVNWISDPMHGNTVKINSFKTRYLEDIANEIKDFFYIQKDMGIKPIGIHLENTYEDVTECIGGEKNTITEKDLPNNYKTYCDPRLNKEQSFEIINLVSNLFKN